MINIKKFSSVGIIGFGAYLPYWRIKVKEITKNWNKDGKKISKSLGVEQKAIVAEDEDCVTMAVEASQLVLKRSKINPKKIGAIFVGSESHPYSVKPSGTVIGEILGFSGEYFCADLEFACKAGTASIQIIAAMIEAGMINYGLAIGSDKAQARPGDVLDYTAAAGAAAFILGKKKEAAIDLISTYSFSSDTPDFWRRQGCQFPSHSGRFTGEPGYFYHLKTSIKNFLKKINKKAKDFDYVIFHMPNAKFPLRLGKKLGFSFSQMELGFLAPKIGNPYSASSLLGLVSVLDQAEADKNILLASYGSGAGSDIFWLRTKKKLLELQKKEKTMKYYLNNYSYLDYFSYLRNYQALKE